VFKHKDLQQQLVDAKLNQAQALLKDSEGRHQKEKDFVSFYVLCPVLQTCGQLKFKNILILYFCWDKCTIHFL